VIPNPEGHRPLAPVRRRHASQIIAPALLLLLLAGAWEAFVRLWAVPSYILPPPSRILIELVTRRALLLDHALTTLQEVLLGFALGVGAGVLLAVVMATVPLLRRSVQPLLIISQTFPKEALAPLFIIWFGFGILSKVVITALICFFPVAIAMLRGLLTVDPGALDLFRLYGASRFKTLIWLRLPSSLPQLFSGLRISATLSVIGAVVGEFVGASKGLGLLIRIANTQLSTALIFASLVVLGLMGTSFYGLVVGTERFLTRWLPHLSLSRET